MAKNKWLTRATRFEKAGQTNQAIEAYRKAVRQDGGSVQAHFHLGTLLAASGDPDAVVHLRQAAALAPEEPSVLNNLSHALRDAGHFDEAAQAFARLERLAPGLAVGPYGSATVAIAQGRLADAERALTEATRRDPSFAQGLRQHGQVLEALGRPQDALVRWNHALALNPRHSATLRHIGLLHALHGREALAKATLGQALQLEPGHALTEHMLRALQGQEAESPDDAYVSQLFDAFAEGYDHHLVNVLETRVPKLVAEAVAGRSYARTLDLGCGTGLLVDVLRPITAHLCGVDLSLKMLARAEARGGYDELVIAGIEPFLQQVAPGVELVVLADVLAYVGPVDDLFAAIARCLAPGGRVVATVEAHDGPGVVLRPTGRYAHNPDDIEAVCTAHGLRVASRQAHELRKEAGQWVSGWLFEVRAPAE